MTNDTNTLNGALQELGETMASNLVSMGVTGADASDGLTTLANNILDIAPSVGGITPTVSIDLSKSPTLICRGATVDIMALVHADYDDTSQTDVDLKGYLQGATVTFKNGNTGIGYAVSDNDGIATLTINDIAMGNYSIVGSFDGTGTDYESATSSAMTFTVNDYPTLTLSADKTSVNVGETVTFTVTAMYNNTPVVGYPIQLYKDGSSMGSLYAGITNSNGECSFTYTIGNNDSDMTINANTISNNISLTVTHYLIIDPLTSDTGIFTIGSTSQASFTSNGLYYNPTVSGNQVASNQIILNQNLPSEFELEITLVSHSKYYTPGIWVNGLFADSGNRTSNTATSLTNDLTNYSGIATFSKNLDGNNHFKYVKQGNDLTLYIDDTLIRTVDVSSYNPIFALCSCCNQNRYVTVKDLKLKQL